MSVADVLEALTPFAPVVLVVLAVSVVLGIADRVVFWVRDI